MHDPFSASQLCWNCSCNSALVVSSPARRPLWSCMARSNVSTWQKGNDIPWTKPHLRSSFNPEPLLHLITTLWLHYITSLKFSLEMDIHHIDPQDAPPITAICALYIPKLALGRHQSFKAFTLPETLSSPLKTGQAPEGNDRRPFDFDIAGQITKISSPKPSPNRHVNTSLGSNWCAPDPALKAAKMN